MKTNHKNIYNRLIEIYIKHCNYYRNKDSKQMCCMWDLEDLPDEIFECDQIYDIMNEFDIDLTEDDAIEMYDMNFDLAVNFIEEKLKNI